MSYSVMLKHFRAADVLIALRAEAGEPRRFRSAEMLRTQYDPWFASDPDYASAWAGAPVEVAA